MLYPVLCPLRNAIPRVSGKGGIQANWRAVTGVNVNNKSWGISEGSRGIITTDTVAEYTAAYKGGGSEQSITWEATYAAEGFQDLRALAALNLLKAQMIEEEKIILGGNNSLALGQVGTVTISLVDDSTTGTLADSITIYVQVVALTMEGYLASSLTGGLPVSGTVTLADGTTEARNMGTSQPSAEVYQATGTGGAQDVHGIRISWPVKNGAVAYAIYWGQNTGATRLGAIVFNNSYLITADTAGSTKQLISALPNSDKSRNSYVYDGFLTQIFNYSTTNAYVYSMATGTPGVGTPLTGDGYGQIDQFETVLQYLWDNYRLSPDEIWWSSDVARTASQKILEGAANAAQRFSYVTTQDNITGGTIVKNYWNKYGLTNEMQSLPLKIHPYLPPGLVFFNTKQLPYALSNVPNVTQLRMRRDYHQVEWPIRKRSWEIGVYWDGVLQCYFPPALGLIRNIASD
jgi:hypothetical protein